MPYTLMRVMILGANSMAGWPLFRRLQGAVGFCSPSTRKPARYGFVPLDLSDGEAVKLAMGEHRPELVVHCGAICKVDKCEKHPEFAHRVNVVGTQNVLEHLPADCRLVYVSSDHVFGGEGGPYDENSPPEPISFYGCTRVAAEELVKRARPGALILRLPLCVGPSYNGRSGHFDWLRYRHAKGLPMTIVRDEFRSVVWTEQAAERVWQFACSDLSGLRHVWGDRLMSRPQLANLMAERQGLEVELKYESRTERSAPHLGRVELRSCYNDDLARPLAFS
ncbi:MAG: sugar nucleotide-binding protein [Candidatus Eremiobacteraeota bacterium]|nr:sugar nucleotide-binding protein [Candidatus Eremiobacteraeota bacterium]